MCSLQLPCDWRFFVDLIITLPPVLSLSLMRQKQKQKQNEVWKETIYFFYLLVVLYILCKEFRLTCTANLVVTRTWQVIVGNSINFYDFRSVICIWYALFVRKEYQSSWVLCSLSKMVLWRRTESVRAPIKRKSQSYTLCVDNSASIFKQVNHMYHIIEGEFCFFLPVSHSDIFWWFLCVCVRDHAHFHGFNNLQTALLRWFQSKCLW